MVKTIKPFTLVLVISTMTYSQSILSSTILGHHCYLLQRPYKVSSNKATVNPILMVLFRFGSNQQLISIDLLALWLFPKNNWYGCCCYFVVVIIWRLLFLPFTQLSLPHIKGHRDNVNSWNFILKVTVTMLIAEIPLTSVPFFLFFWTTSNLSPVVSLMYGVLCGICASFCNTFLFLVYKIFAYHQ